MAKVLCIEDEADLRSDIVEELEDAGYQVFQAVDGEDGLRAILHVKPDLVLSDITMPNMDGFELLRELRAKHRDMADMPFIFLSALADRVDEIEGVKLGADDYLKKPVDYEIMLTRIDASLRQAERVREKKQAEQVKLYKALTGNAPEETQNEAEPGPVKSDLPPLRINLVGRSHSRLWEFFRILEDDGHKVTAFTSGRSYLDCQEDFPAHISFICLHTDDMQAPMVARMSDDNQGVISLMVPAEFDTTGNKAAMSNFDTVQYLPAEPDELFKQMKDWLLEKAA